MLPSYIESKSDLARFDPELKYHFNQLEKEAHHASVVC